MVATSVNQGIDHNDWAKKKYAVSLPALRVALPVCDLLPLVNSLAVVYPMSGEARSPLTAMLLAVLQ